MGKRLINVDEVEEIVPVLVGKLLENNLITEEQADQIICAIFNDNDRLNEIRELNPDYDISMHKLNVCVGGLIITAALEYYIREGLGYIPS